MAFGAYLECATKLQYVNDFERDTVSKILRIAREKPDRSLRTPPGMNGCYIEPEYFEKAIENTVSLGPRSKRLKKEVIRWISMPYFSLKSHSLSNHNAVTLNPHLTHNRSVAQGRYFQVAQYWCLVIGDSLLISCAPMSVPELSKTTIHLNYIPLADHPRLPTGDWAPMLEVSDSGLRLWLLSIEECLTWSTFVSHFIGLGFSLVDGWRVKYRDVILDQSDWPTVISMARISRVRLELCRSDYEDPADGGDSLVYDSHMRRVSRSMSAGQAPKHDDDQTEPEPLRPLISDIPLSESDPLLMLDGSHATSDRESYGFHVFTLLATVPTSPTPRGESSSQQGTLCMDPLFKVDERQLSEDLNQLDEYLSSGNTRRMECVSYQECLSKTLYDVQQSCTKLNRDEYSLKKNLFRAVRDIFELYLPLRCNHTVALKFWGSIDHIIQTKGIASEYTRFEEDVRDISQLGQLAKEIKEEIFSGKELVESMITIPHEFIQAWLLFQMFLACFFAESARRSSSHIRRCKQKLLKGRLKMVERLQTVNIREREAVLPLGVTALMLGQLLDGSQVFTPSGPHSLTSAYWTCFNDLKSEVYNKPLRRHYEAEFTTLKADFETIITTLEDQQRVLVALEDSVKEAESHSFANNSLIGRNIIMEPSREASTTAYLVHRIEEMLQNFWEMSRRLNELENYHFQCLSIDTDMQQKASFAFTTVTVFFLPLTTVTGILGMNTSDIRDMSAGQGLFWTVAIPLGLACLFTWLMYLGSFGKMWRWGKKRGLKKTL
ncbi:hypothetical protein K458DRAFT_424536 [Lentithecium fluviatile CBS 122367]|uniref:Cora-domain-containing protein n=1 Tax=Lentithecium fluviatile CBS 122367 TaxID=1168545 RepID=A0A6G1IFW1_9PLEO|nr:hypothetical protein K458DRAFT_424536 [Lentithecium fluviatile CBS 122367]